MDADLRTRYLQAMGIQVWRTRDWDAVEAMDVAPEVGQGGESAEAPSQAGVPAQAQALAQSPATTEAQVQQAAGSTTAATEFAWDNLRVEVAGCRACGLCETRTQTVFGVGNRNADLMIIGEAPGVDEDRAGEPFVGRAGRLLNLMLAAIGLRRDQVYIANILKCHPPRNRDPEPEEAQRCEPFLLQQLELVRPRLVLSVGRISAQNLLRTGTAVGRLRGQWFELGPEKLPLMVTYHPAYLLRSPAQKRLVWQDLQGVARRLRELQNSPAGRGVGC